MDYLAHSPRDGQGQALPDHLLAVATRAGELGQAFGAGDLAYVAGLVHDLGKTSAQFQQYLRGLVTTGGDHKLAGAQWVYEQFGGVVAAVIAPVVLGHHGGLPALATAVGEVKKLAAPGLSQTWQALGLADKMPSPALPEWLDAKDAATCELFIRLLFSALVDADYLDTESHFHPQQAALRGQFPGLGEVHEAFTAAYASAFGSTPESVVNQVRREVHEACVKAAQGPPGAYSLTVPTGGGKTLASLAFGLNHALRHGLERIIVVIPYTSIIEQTADVYRKFVPPAAVLEHHSALASEDGAANTGLHRLAAENWDAPLIVTTAVQFFESLFAHRPGRCRKLHHVARSVVIVDETQTLPVGLLQPTFAVLKELVAHYGVTVLLTSATQPAYEKFTDLPITEIAPDPVGLAQQLKRVQFTHQPQPLTWAEVAQFMQGKPQAMAVVNTRGDAQALYEQLPGDCRLLLSTRLCGAHRRQVLEEVRQRLQEGQPCLLATTQLVEAGVDLDFPLVLRATGPLVNMVQAAGRCNREGCKKTGEVIVFEAKEGHLPPGAYQTATDQTRSFLAGQGEADLADPKTHAAFFASFYQAADLDAKGISKLRKSLDFPAVSEAYRVIEDDTTPVVECWGEAKDLLTAIGQQKSVTWQDLRRLQPYFVNLRAYELKEAQKAGLCAEVLPGSGLWRWDGKYDPNLGLQWEHDTQVF
ncbi:MAG: CRISPR-associated endonuclease Cas3'' [Armatimonadetes bacterium]|nr:CRISPR-associated endonuclease Cas3'' [Armatimonadota bacterium]